MTWKGNDHICLVPAAVGWLTNLQLHRLAKAYQGLDASISNVVQMLDSRHSEPPEWLTDLQASIPQATEFLEGLDVRISEMIRMLEEDCEKGHKP